MRWDETRRDYHFVDPDLFDETELGELGEFSELR